MAALQGVITQNVPGNTQQIVFQNPSFLDSITYSSSGFTYPISSSFTLSQSDLALFLQYIIQFYNSIFYNFPFLNSQFSQPLPFSNTEVYYVPGPDFLYYYQTSSNPALQVYQISIHNGTKVSTFAARASAVTITNQEFLFSYQILISYLNKCTQA